MTSPPFTVDLLELAADVALVGAPRDDVASEILATHSLPDVFARLAAVPTGSKEESDLCVFLERMFATAPGATLLPSAMPYAEAGLAAASPRVRRLACAQLERAFAQLATEPSDTDDDSRSCVPDEIVRELIETIRDPDPGVAAAASSALAALSPLCGSSGSARGAPRPGSIGGIGVRGDRRPLSAIPRTALIAARI